MIKFTVLSNLKFCAKYKYDDVCTKEPSMHIILFKYVQKVSSFSTNPVNIIKHCDNHAALGLNSSYLKFYWRLF